MEFGRIREVSYSTEMIDGRLSGEQYYMQGLHYCEDQHDMILEGDVI